MKETSTDNEFFISKEELSIKAKLVLDLATSNCSKGVIGIFKEISLPFTGNNYKRLLFEKIFELANIEYEWSNNLGFIIFSENRTKKTVVSHMDLIPRFNKGFKENKVYEIKDDKLIGALDNTFTNAVVINQILNNQNEDTTYLFTLDEETSQHAIRDYMVQYGVEQFIINLDVTNDGWKKNMSIEYDEPNYHICKQIKENMDSPYFTTERVGDDLDEVLKAKGYGFSYCIPTNKTIHSYKNYTMLDKIEPYMDGLEFLIQELNINSIEQNISYLDIDSSLKFKTFTEMKEKDVFISEYVEKSNNDDYKSKDKFSNLIYDIALNIDPNCKENLTNLLDQSLFSYDFFTENEFVDFLSEDIFFEFLYSRIIINTHSDYYEFDSDLTETTKFKIYNILSKFKNINYLEFFRLISVDESESFSYEELLDLEKNKKVQNISEPISRLIKSGLIMKEKEGDRFHIL